MFEWFQARIVLPNGQEDGMGIIPSKKRWERKQKARDRSVKFQGKSPTQETSKTDMSVSEVPHFFYGNWMRVCQLNFSSDVDVGAKEKELFVHTKVSIYEVPRQY